jgi:methylated-DNA-[protein]-cysteine S-methyltransferase
MCAMQAPTATARIDTPIGAIAITATPDTLTGVRILPRQRGAMSADDHPVLRETAAQLGAWFAGELTAFDLPLAPLDTAEGERLRAGIASIPYGETLTYGALATRVGSVARAVGQACKSNPFPIIIPCHRVVSASGTEYYSGGNGPRTKTWLIDFEQDHLPPEKRTRLI